MLTQNEWYLLQTYMEAEMVIRMHDTCAHVKMFVVFALSTLRKLLNSEDTSRYGSQHQDDYLL